jgi:hypothetical protein
MGHARNRCPHWCSQYSLRALRESPTSMVEARTLWKLHVASDRFLPAHGCLKRWSEGLSESESNQIKLVKAELRLPLPLKLPRVSRRAKGALIWDPALGRRRSLANLAITGPNLETRPSTKADSDERVQYQSSRASERAGHCFLSAAVGLLDKDPSRGGSVQVDQLYSTSL